MSRRIKEYSKFVANSVGVSHLDINSYSKTKRQKFYDITKTAFYWGQDSATNPAALLKLVEGSSNKVCSKKGNRPAFWPTSGVPILIPKALSSVRDCGSSDNYHVKLLIIGGVICRHDSEETTNGRIVESLSFETVKTVMLLVHNPYDPPNMWKSSQITIPSTPEGFYTW